MTKERAKELLPIITAFAEGKTIQNRPKERTMWTDVVGAPLFSDDFEYRVKPEPREFFIVVSTSSNRQYREKPVVDGKATDELGDGIQPAGNWEVIRVREVID